MRYEIRETGSNKLVTRYAANQLRNAKIMADGTYRYLVDTKDNRTYSYTAGWQAGDRPADLKPSWSA
jgi:hypothetical protein